MSTSTDWWTTIKGAIAGLVLALAGCDELPSLPTSPVASAGGDVVSGDVVSDQGRGGYHWRLNGHQFEMQRPTSFTLVGKLQPEVIKSNLAAFKPKEERPWRKPAEMDEDVYLWFRRFTEPQPEPRLLMELERSDDVGVECVCLNAQGNRLLTIAGKLIEWDVETGKKTKEFDAPITGCKAMRFDPSQESVVIQSPEKLVKVSLADGRVVHSWKPPKGEIESFDQARQVDAQAVMTTGNQLFALAENFQQVVPYEGKAFDSKRISMHPKGLWILGVNDGEMVRWRLDTNDRATEVMPVEALDRETCVPMAGAIFDRWADTRYVHELNGTHEFLLEQHRYPFIMTNAFILAVGNATVDGTQDWLVIVGQNFDEAGKPVQFIQDFRFDAFEYSVPWPLPVSECDHFFFDASCEHVVLGKGNKLHVYDRRRWVDPSGWSTAQRVGMLLAEGRTEQLELCANELRQIPVHLNGRPGQVIFEDVLDHIAGQWARLESEPASDEIMQSIAQWYEAGSELALLASAERHTTIGSEARGGGYADSVTSQGWATLGDRTQLALQDVKKLLDQGKVTPAAVVQLISCSMTSGNASYHDVEPWLVQAAERYPDDVRPIAAMSNWLLPRWGGSTGEAGAMVAALTARYPAPEGDLVYARTASMLIETLGTEPLQSEAGFSPLKIIDAVDPMLASGNATRRDVELLMQIAQQAQKPSVVKRLADYHIRHFGMPSHNAYQRNLLLVLTEAKEALLVKAKEAQR